MNKPKKIAVLVFATVLVGLFAVQFVQEKASLSPGSVSVPTPPPASPESIASQASSHESAGEKQHEHPGDNARPSPETIQAIRDIRKPAEGEGQVTEYPDGSASIKLGNRYRSVPVATIGADGKVHVDYHGEKYLPEQTTTEVTNP